MALRFFTAGESHGKGIFTYIEGIPANFEVDFGFINNELSKRQGGYGRGKRMTIERDKVDFLSGVRLGKTLGTPIVMAIWNRDYENWKNIMKPERGVLPEDKKVTRPRPGHADLPGVLKRGFDDIRNVLERSSARETSGRVAAGALCKNILKKLSIDVGSYVLSIGTKSIDEKGLTRLSLDERVSNADGSDVRIPLADKSLEQLMKDEIDNAKKLGESLGGTFQVFVSGLPAGIGDYTQWDKRLDGKLAQAVMSVQAIKGVEIGYGFKLSSLYGSKAHDEIFYDGRFYRKTNRAGGIEGGMSNGEPIVLTAAMKPIPTLYNPLMSVDIKTTKPFKASIERSDVCAVPAASIVAESMVSIVILDTILEMFPSMNFKVLERNLENYRKLTLP